MAIFSHFWSFLANCSYFCHFWSICPLGNFWAILAIFVLISFSLFFSGWFKHKNRILPTVCRIDGFCLRRLQKSTPKFNWESRQAKSCAKNVRIYFSHFWPLLATFCHFWPYLDTKPKLSNPKWQNIAKNWLEHGLWPFMAVFGHFWPLLATFSHFWSH